MAAETTTLGYNAAMGLALVEEMRADERVFVLGQGVATGGWFGAEKGLVTEFGRDRVLDTNISEAFEAGFAAGRRDRRDEARGQHGLRRLRADRRRRDLPQARQVALHARPRLPDDGGGDLPDRRDGWRRSRAFELHRGARDAFPRSKGRRAIDPRRRKGANEERAPRTQPGAFSQRAEPRLGQGRSTARPVLHGASSARPRCAGQVAPPR